jgi:hypothetical protein
MHAAKTGGTAATARLLTGPHSPLRFSTSSRGCIAGTGSAAAGGNPRQTWQQLVRWLSELPPATPNVAPCDDGADWRARAASASAAFGARGYMLRVERFSIMCGHYCSRGPRLAGANALADPRSVWRGAAAAGDAVQQPPVQHGRCRSPSDEAACAGRFGCAGCAENTSCANRHVEHGESRGLPDTRVRITTLPAGAPARPRSRVGRRQTRSDDRRGALRAVRVLSDHATGHIN